MSAMLDSLMLWPLKQAGDAVDIVATFWLYISSLAFYAFHPGAGPRDCPYLTGRPDARLHLYALAKTMHLLGSRHYRATYFRDDIVANLSNVAIPGTGIPMSWFFALGLFSYVPFLLVVYPLAALVGALYQNSLGTERSTPLNELFAEYLLTPTNWFALWRLNSLLAAYHAHATGIDTRRQYCMEDKGMFLIEGADKGVPVSPFLQPGGTGGLVIKHKSVEGGMGIHIYTSFTHGGDWIMQEQLTNAPFIARLLPAGAPLSTLRVLTTSVRWLKQQHAKGANPVTINGNGVPFSTIADGVLKPGPFFGASYDDDGISVMTVVWRAGRAGNLTDHASVCFNVDPLTGRIGRGITNGHWYNVGPLRYALSLKDAHAEEYDCHPDTGKPITGQIIPDLSTVLALCRSAHATLIPDVPCCGWDVALTAQHGAVLLEANLSCNLFNGAYDSDAYTGFMTQHFQALEAFQKSRGKTDYWWKLW